MKTCSVEHKLSAKPLLLHSKNIPMASTSRRNSKTSSIGYFFFSIKTLRHCTVRKARLVLGTRFVEQTQQRSFVSDIIKRTLRSFNFVARQVTRTTRKKKFGCGGNEKADYRIIVGAESRQWNPHRERNRHSRRKAIHNAKYNTIRNESI